MIVLAAEFSIQKSEVSFCGLTKTRVTEIIVHSVLKSEVSYISSLGSTDGAFGEFMKLLC